MLPEVERPVIANRFPELIMAQSTRYGGVSLGSYASLNLGLHTGDAAGVVFENRRRFWNCLGTTEEHTAGGYQQHGSAVKLVTEPGYFDGYDAFVTNVPGVFLSITVADCSPVLVYDPVRRAIAAVHAGWRGTLEGISGKVIAFLQEAYGTDPSDCIAYIGACISYDAFEVNEEVAMGFPPGLRRPSKETGKYLVDLKSSQKRQLMEAGLKEGSVEVSPFCTVRDAARFFSYRKEGGVTGRMLAVAGML